MASRLASTVLVTAVVVALSALIFTVDAQASTIATRLPSERNCRSAWDVGSNEANRHRLTTSGQWKKALLVDVVAASPVTIPGTPSGSVSLPACLLLVRDGDRAREVIGRWRHGRVTQWTFSRVFQLTLRVKSNGRVLRDGRVTTI